MSASKASAIVAKGVVSCSPSSRASYRCLSRLAVAPARSFARWKVEVGLLTNGGSIGNLTKCRSHSTCINTRISSNGFSIPSLVSSSLLSSNPFNVGKSSSCWSMMQSRNLSLHEHQSMTLMSKYGISTPVFAAARTPQQAKQAAIDLLTARQQTGNTDPIDFVIKAQVHSGGRGLGYFRENGFRGGVHICTSPEQVEEIARKMLGNTLITKQTGSEGKPCNEVLICERFYIRTERYFAILLDRESCGPLLVGSACGGTSIEDIAERTPEAIVKLAIPPAKGGTSSVGTLTQELASDFARRLGFSSSPSSSSSPYGSCLDQAVKNIMGLHELFVKNDCLLVEVNPFAETNDGRVLVCDAKVNFDDNSSFRQESIFAQADLSQEDPREVEAGRHNLNYVGLTGAIGCMVNGAGLAMATMDLIQLCGGFPANFLDVGGGADGDQIVQALKLLQSDPRVKAILINIFGGIMRCDIIAKGIVDATKTVGLTKPLVVRLEGTNRDEAKQLLQTSGVKITFESDLQTAAQKAVQMSNLVQLAEDAKLNISISAA